MEDVYKARSNEFVGVREAARYLGYSVNYLYNLVSKGEVKVYKCGNKRNGKLRFLKRDLNIYLGRTEDDNS